MAETDDITLLRRWAQTGSETAFRTLVERYAPLVWGAVLRKTNDHDMAEEAVQQVFADLARKAAVLVALARPLAAWLHRAAVYEAVQVLRRELRHRDRMKHYADTDPAAPSPPDPWADVRPHLDDAINSLSEADRRVLLLHWFERRTFAEVADHLGCSSAAAQRRGLRALDKLAASLRRRGAIASAAVLAAGLTLQLTPSVPAAVLTTLGSAAAGAAAPVSLLQQCLHAMASAKLTTAAVVLFSASIPVGVQYAATQRTDRTHRTYATDSPPESSALPANAPGKPAVLDLSLVQNAINRLLAHADDYQTQLELRRLMLSLSAEEIRAVQALLMAVPGKKKEALNEVCHALFARWAELDPATATEEAFAIAKSGYGFYPRSAAFVTWAAADLDAAWVWLEKKTTDAMDRQFLLGEALETIAGDESKCPALMIRVDAMTDHAWRDQMRYWLLRGWVQHPRPNAAVDWAEALPDEAERTEWVGKAVQMTGEHNSPGTALKQLDRIENPDRRAEVAHNVLWSWLLAQPREAYAELEQHTTDWPEDLFRDAGDALTRHDAAYAVEAALRLPEGRFRERFVRGMLTGLTYSQDPAALLPAVRLLNPDELVHTGGLSQFVGALTKRNPRAAAEWIATLPPGSDARKWADSTFQSNSAAK